jgi:hypothetical protein
MIHDSVSYDNHDNQVKLDKREKINFDAEFAFAFIRNHVLTMFIGALGAIALLSFLPHFMELYGKGYDVNLVLEYTFQRMHTDFFPHAGVQDFPKAWLIPTSGALLAFFIRQFYIAD